MKKFAAIVRNVLTTLLFCLATVSCQISRPACGRPVRGPGGCLKQHLRHADDDFPNDYIRWTGFEGRIMRGPRKLRNIDWNIDWDFGQPDADGSFKISPTDFGLFMAFHNGSDTVTIVVNCEEDRDLFNMCRWDFPPGIPGTGVRGFTQLRNVGTGKCLTTSTDMTVPLSLQTCDTITPLDPSQTFWLDP
jgi:hypothetical protein